MMSITGLRQYLSSQYTLKCFVDLEYMSLAPSNAYKQFQACYQETFNTNDRLVFYTTDIIPKTLLDHLYQAASQIDVSNFFVLICSPYDISEQVKSDNPFQTLQLEFEKTSTLQNNYFVPDTLCPMPWMHLEVTAPGKIRPCCVSSQTIGHVKDLTLQDAFSSDMLSELRQDLLDGKKPPGCQKCWDLEGKGLISNRTYHMQFLKTELLTNALDYPKIKSLDLKPGNTCNFKCRICNPVASSLFAQEVSKFRTTPLSTFNWAEDNSKTINEIASLLSSISNLDMYGGEPFLIKPLSHLVKQAVDLDYAKNIRLHYNSNGSIYPEHLIDYWKHFRHIDIHFSIDNIGQRFELERGGNWNQIDANIRKLVSLGLPNINVSVMPAISIMNVFYLNELLAWAHDLGLAVNPLYVSNPYGFDLKNLTHNAKKLIVQKLQGHSWPELKNILTYIKSVPDSDGVEFIKLCNHFDSIRNQDFTKSHPEIAEAMGYTKHTI
jgi:MoaA/NifB/PqqE/SkfB family radical SAM enzyme